MSFEVKTPEESEKIVEEKATELMNHLKTMEVGGKVGYILTVQGDMDFYGGPIKAQAKQYYKIERIR